jgi:hypothetical protein
VLVAHGYNPSYYSGGRDQKDCGSKPAQAQSSQDTFSINKNWVCWGEPVIAAMQQA